MYFISFLLILALAAPFRALAAAVPLDTTAQLQERDNALTISIKNQYGSPLFLTFESNLGVPGFNGNPQPQKLSDYGEWSVPPQWAGRIKVVKDGATSDSDMKTSSKIEGSYSGTQPVYIDVSYVDGYSVPITCGMNDAANEVGCNIELFDKGKCESGGFKGSICPNPQWNVPNGPASSFFAPCQGAAYTFPKDDKATEGLWGNHLSCCVGSLCVPSVLQH
ncbi:MAG: hypothetical protein Q9214_000818 [Letrouitia sp. 1 TL-2023]